MISSHISHTIGKFFISRIIEKAFYQLNDSHHIFADTIAENLCDTMDISTILQPYVNIKHINDIEKTYAQNA